MINAKYLWAAGAVVTWTIFIVWATSHYKDKAYKKFIEKHDKETAERLSEQFNKEIDKAKENCRKVKEEFNRKVNEICCRYGIPNVAD